ncbi:hypothetical protein RF107_14785, partial [Escherichia coli]
LSEGPMIVACQWNMSSATGPALHDVGGSFCKSLSSFKIRFDAIARTSYDSYLISHADVKADRESTTTTQEIPSKQTLIDERCRRSKSVEFG